MKILLNGKEAEVEEDCSLSVLLSNKGMEDSRVLVSVNKEIIELEDYPTYRLADGDELEIFGFVSGG